MAASMILLMIPHAEDVLIFVGNMVGGETHLLGVSLGEESPYIFCTTCSKGSMGNYMATIVYHLFLYDVDTYVLLEHLGHASHEKFGGAFL